MYYLFMKWIIEFVKSGLKQPCNKQVKLGRWALKHNCPSEEIAVFNANRDNCGDKLCGDVNDYARLVPKGKRAEST